MYNAEILAQEEVKYEGRDISVPALWELAPIMRGFLSATSPRLRSIIIMWIGGYFKITFLPLTI